MREGTGVRLRPELITFALVPPLVDAYPPSGMSLPTPQEYAEALGLQLGPHAVTSALVVDDALNRCLEMVRGQPAVPSLPRPGLTCLDFCCYE